MRHLRPVTHRQDAFVLLEVILALALFATVAVGMTKALDMMAQSSRLNRQETQVIRVLESVLAEVAHQVELKPTTVHFPVTDDRIGASAEIRKVRLITKNKTELDHMFIIRAEAWVQDGGEQLVKRALETYVYSPNSPS